MSQPNHCPRVFKRRDDMRNQPGRTRGGSVRQGLRSNVGRSMSPSLDDGQSRRRGP